MKYIKHLTAGLVVCVLPSLTKATRIEIQEQSLFAPHTVAKRAALSYDSDKEQFIATLDGKAKVVNKHDISGIPPTLSEEQLESFLKDGYFSLGKIGEDVSLKAFQRGRGGVYIARQLGAAPGSTGETVGRVAGGASGAALAVGLGGWIGGPPGALVGAAGYLLTYGGEAAGSTGPRPNVGSYNPGFSIPNPSPSVDPGFYLNPSSRGMFSQPMQHSSSMAPLPWIPGQSTTLPWGGAPLPRPSLPYPPR